MIFTGLPTALLEFQKSHFKTIDSLRETLFSAAENLMRLNTAIARTALLQNAEAIQYLYGAKHPRDTFVLSVESAVPALEEVAAYSRKVYDVAQGARAEIFKIAERQVSQIKQQIAAFSEFGDPDSPFGMAPAALMVKHIVSVTLLGLEFALPSSLDRNGGQQHVLAANPL